MTSPNLPMRVRSRLLNWDQPMGTVKEDFPRILQKLMTDAGMNKTALATALGVSNSTVGQWLSGKNLPELARLDDIATLFKVSREYLVASLDTATLADPWDDVRRVLKKAGFKLVRDP